jgi:glucose/arabinose dehydrogenase
MMIKNNFGITINLYKADFNLKKINFKLLFESKEYWENYNVFSGGRVEKFIDDKILFSIGFSKNYKAPQDKKSLLGKIIAVDLKSKSYELISYGHRNPQGLYFNSNNNLIINTEHGPKGGDEINFNFLNIKEDKNFGWPRVSYGKAYSGEEKFFDKDTFKKSHEELGFIEPFKYFDPSIGISEIIYFEENSFCKFKCLLVSSLRANSVYIFEISDDYKEIVSERRIYLSGNRIRDISYDRDLDLIILLSEEVPAVVSIKKGLN